MGYVYECRDCGRVIAGRDRRAVEDAVDVHEQGSGHEMNRRTEWERDP